jgi:hypothetical protein
MEDKEIIDQSQLAQDVAEKIRYDFYDYFLVKPLDPIKVKKEVSKPVATGDPKKDKDGIEAQDFDKVETEVVEVNSDYRKGVVIKRPLLYDNEETKDKAVVKAEVGDIVLFRDAAGLRFDLVKDSRLLRMYDILGIEKQK